MAFGFPCLTPGTAGRAQRLHQHRIALCQCRCWSLWSLNPSRREDGRDVNYRLRGGKKIISSRCGSGRVTAAHVRSSCTGCAGASLGKTRLHTRVRTYASIPLSIVRGCRVLAVSAPVCHVCWRRRENCCWLGHGVESMPRAPGNPLWLVSV